MRLIDADDFFARMENDTDLCAEMESDGLKALKKYLDMQPTAYSIDKVAEELRRVSGNGYKDIDGDYVPPMIETKNAIEIVKQGIRKDISE